MDFSLVEWLLIGIVVLLFVILHTLTTINDNLGKLMEHVAEIRYKTDRL